MKNIINNITLIFLPIIILLSTIGCDAKMEKFTETRFKMGTIVQITIFEKDKEIAEKQINKAFAEIDRISSLFYEGSLESEIYKFNHRNSDTVEVSSEVSDLLGRANQISKNTFGAFDMTVGTLRDLYNFKKGQEKIPDSIDVLKTIKKIGYNKLHINLRENLLIGDNQYFTLLTGAIVKGYAADRAAKIINKENRNGILINAGGDIRATKRYDNKKWVVGIQNPQKKDELLGTISIFEGAVVTSGDYEQFSIIFLDGFRRKHTIGTLQRP